MQTGRCTPWKMRDDTSGWWPSGVQSITQAGQGHHLGQQAQLGHRKRAQLQLKGHQALQGRFDAGRHGALALILADARCQMAQHTQHIGAGAGGRVSHRHAGVGQPLWQAETRALLGVCRAFPATAIECQLGQLGQCQRTPIA